MDPKGGRRRHLSFGRRSHMPLRPQGKDLDKVRSLVNIRNVLSFNTNPFPFSAATGRSLPVMRMIVAF
jgi:hypothetical protein